jgi:hypothetical protein
MRPRGAVSNAAHATEGPGRCCRRHRAPRGCVRDRRPHRCRPDGADGHAGRGRVTHPAGQRPDPLLKPVPAASIRDAAAHVDSLRRRDRRPRVRACPRPRAAIVPTGSRPPPVPKHYRCIALPHTEEADDGPGGSPNRTSPAPTRGCDGSPRPPRANWWSPRSQPPWPAAARTTPPPVSAPPRRSAALCRGRPVVLARSSVRTCCRQWVPIAESGALLCRGHGA